MLIETIDFLSPIIDFIFYQTLFRNIPKRIFIAKGRLNPIGSDRIGRSYQIFEEGPCGPTTPFKRYYFIEVSLIFRKNCFTTDYFKGCLDVLLLTDEMEKIQMWIKQLHGADPGVQVASFFTFMISPFFDFFFAFFFFVCHFHFHAFCLFLSCFCNLIN